MGGREQVPKDVWRMIFEMLPIRNSYHYGSSYYYKAFFNARCVCRAWRDICDKSDRVWMTWLNGHVPKTVIVSKGKHAHKQCTDPKCRKQSHRAGVVKGVRLDHSLPLYLQCFKFAAEKHKERINRAHTHYVDRRYENELHVAFLRQTERQVQQRLQRTEHDCENLYNAIEEHRALKKYYKHISK